MFGRLFRRSPDSAGIPSALYGAIVARAREPSLFRDFGVPDTIEGRFEMVVLHTVLAIRRLRALGEEGKGIAQEVFDLFCLDMDRSLREMGISDLSVPKRMRKVGEGFYGRAQAYDAALDTGDRTGLAAAIGRNVFAGEGTPVAEAGLADYMSASARRLAATPLEDLKGGAFRLPDPSAFLQTTSIP